MKRRPEPSLEERVKELVYERSLSHKALTSVINALDALPRTNRELDDAREMARAALRLHDLATEAGIGDPPAEAPAVADPSSAGPGLWCPIHKATHYPCTPTNLRDGLITLAAFARSAPGQPPERVQAALRLTEEAVRLSEQAPAVRVVAHLLTPRHLDSLAHELGPEVCARWRAGTMSRAELLALVVEPAGPSIVVGSCCAVPEPASSPEGGPPPEGPAT